MKSKDSSKTHLIQPGTAEWDSALRDAGELSSGGLSPVIFETVPCVSARSPKLEIAHTMLPNGAGTVRIIFHFKNISVPDISDLLSLLQQIVREANITSSVCNASVSEVFRNQYDFVWLELPEIRAKLLRYQILERALKLLRV
jgi:hypothetical protein